MSQTKNNERKQDLISTTDSDKRRFTATVDKQTYLNVVYWAKKTGVSLNDFFRDALAHYISFQNKDYDLPSLEIQRLNQLIDSMAVLSSNINSLEKVVVSGFDSLISLTRGDNYLLDEDDGEIGVDNDDI